MAVKDIPHLFFAPDLEPGTVALDLDREESTHIRKALRLRNGDELFLTNGRGLQAKARIIGFEGLNCNVEVISSTAFKRREYRLHLAVAPTKNHDRFEWFVEKSVEFGVDQITPLVCEHSERTSVQRERLRRLMVAAIKQSGQCFLPTLDAPCTLTDLLKMPLAGSRFIAWCGSESVEPFFKCLKAGESVCILVGPEGDFSASEVEMASACGFLPISLGKSRLRTETAGVAACQIFNLKNEL